MVAPANVNISSWTQHPYPPYRDGRYPKTVRPALPFFQSDCSEFSLGTINGANKGPFDEINITSDGIGGPFGAPACVNTDSHSGTQCVELGYPGNEAGCEFKTAFTPTRTLFCRKFEKFDANWPTNWPIGLKTSRYFSNTIHYQTVSPDGWAYHSEKMVWQTYLATCNELYGMGLNSALFNDDNERTYAPEQLFGNGLPYIRAGHWYRIETWMIMNSADDVADGVIEIRIDGITVLSRTDVAFVSTTRGCPNGVRWGSMWFGGNYSGATCGGPAVTVNRYIDDMYLSTTADWAA